MTYSIDRPIFIVGTGRCGSTILNKLLAEHPNLSFLTTASVVFPSKLRLQKQILNLWDKPIVGSLLRLRLIAGEAWPFWDQYIAGFSQSFRDFQANDVTLSQKQAIQDTLPNLLSGKRNRFLFKFTGWTRIGFIKEVFPDAKIIHITRDPRAVINSMLHIDFWQGRLGPYQLNWGGLSPKEMEIWNQHGQSFITLAAIEYNRIMSAYHDSLQSLSQEAKQDVLEISYTTLCKDHIKKIKEVLTFTGLECDGNFTSLLTNFKLKSQNEKWKSTLTKIQQQELESIVHELDLNRFENR